MREKRKPRLRPRAIARDGESEADMVFDAKRREIYITGEIDETSVHYTYRALRALDISEKPITIMLNTPGGYMGDGYALYDMIRMAKNEIIIKGFGEVMSMGAIILQAGDQRLLAPYCRFMIHDGNCPLDMPIPQLQLNVKELKELTKNYHKILAEKSKLSVDAIRRLCQNDAYMSSEKAIRNGFADGLVTE